MRAAAAPRAGASDVLGAAELALLRNVRAHFAQGGLPSRAERSPADDARIAVFTTIDGLVRTLDAFRNRVAHGEAVRLVVREQASMSNALRVELVIKPGGPS